MLAQKPLFYDVSGLSPDLRSAIESPKYRHLFTKAPEKLLGLDTNAKTVKGRKKGFRTAILYLAPADMSGVNVCALAALALCKSPCLFSAGRGQMTINVLSRLRKTLYWLQHKEAFLAQLREELSRLSARAANANWDLLVRLNGTSDIRWEIYGIPQAFPEIQFYDYTKLPNRKNVPENYDLTFSYSGAKAFKPFVKQAIASGARIAVVFRDRSSVRALLERNATFEGLPLVDGDDTDIRHLDPKGAVVALYAKGAAVKDRSGFVVDVE